MAFAALFFIRIQFALLRAIHFPFLTATIKGMLLSLALFVAFLRNVEGTDVSSSSVYAPTGTNVNNSLFNVVLDRQNVALQATASPVALLRRRNAHRWALNLMVSMTAALAVALVILGCFKVLRSMQSSSPNLRRLAQGGGNCEGDEEEAPKRSESPPQNIPSSWVVLIAPNGKQVNVRLRELYTKADVPPGCVIKTLPPGASYPLIQMLQRQGRLMKVALHGHFFFFIKFYTVELDAKEEQFDPYGNREQVLGFLNIVNAAISLPPPSPDEGPPELPPPDYESHVPPEIIPPPDYRIADQPGSSGMPPSSQRVQSPPHSPPPMASSSLGTEPVSEASGPSGRGRERSSQDAGQRESSPDGDSSGEQRPRGILRVERGGSKKRRVRFSDEESD